MRPFTIRLIIASSLFILIVATSLTWFVSQIPKDPRIPETKASIDIPSAKAALDPTIYPVLFCDLIQFPERYDRKLIRTRAIFVHSVDYFYLKDDTCPVDDVQVAAVGPIESDDKLVGSQSRRRIGAVLERLLRQRDGAPLEVNADMVGRFYAGDKYGRGRQFAILDEIDASPTGKRW